MKIAVVSQFYHPTQFGGAEVSAKLLAEALVQRGHQVTVLACDGITAGEMTVNGVRVIRYRFIKGLYNRAQPATLLPMVTRSMMQFQNEHNLFHIYNVWPLPGAGMYKMLGGNKPVVATLNNYACFCPIYTGLCPGNGCHFIQRTKCIIGFSAKKPVSIMLSTPYSSIYPVLTGLTKMADRYIALSESSKQVHINHGYDKDRIDVIPNFIEPYTLPDSPGLENPQTFNILYLGSLAKEKGVDILIKAFFKLSRENKNMHLTVVGEGPQMAQLVELVSTLSIEERVVFTGKVSHYDIWMYYRNADVFVHPGIWAEPFGRTILEAMQFHLPLVVSDVGAPPEIASNAGLVFKAGDVDDLASKIETIYSDMSIRKDLSSNCAGILARYEKDAIIEQILEVYQRVLKSN